MLKINNKFAKKYEEYRRKEELQKFKDKFGDVKLSEARSKSAAAATADSDGDQSTSSESEDEDCEGWTPQTEAGFLRVYAALQSGDSRLYDPSVSWFKAEEEEEESGDSQAEGQYGEGEHKPMYYNEYHRNYLLKGAYTQEDAVADETSAATQRDLVEAERIRKSLAESHADRSDSDDSTGSNGEDAILVKKNRRRGQANGDTHGEEGEADPMARLHKFVSVRNDNGEDLGLETELKDDLARLKRHWTGEAGPLTESERYLRDYITKEYWRRPPQQAARTAQDGEGEGEDPLSDDEAFLARQSEFESKWNGRSEAAEPDQEFEAAYRRTVASGERLLGDAGSEGDDEDELFVAKSAPSDDDADADCDVDKTDEVEADLRRLDRQRQWRLEGEGDDGEDEDEATQEAESTAKRPEIRAYPRRIAESLRQSTTDVARAQRRSERRERRRAEKMSRKRELARLVTLKEAEVERRLERLRRNAGVDESARDRLAEAMGGDFLDAEFDPAEHDQRMARLFDRDFYGEGEERVKRPVFSDDEELPGSAEAEAEAEVQRLRDQVDRLHAEDLIRAGPGQADLRCRFNYREVEPNDFGLSAVEVLLADDRELNAWCALRKASQYREREADRRDRRRFHAARCQARKEQLLAGMLRRLEAAAAYPDAQSWAAAAARVGDPAELAGVAADATASTKRRRRKKNRSKEPAAGRDAETTTSAAAAGDDEPRPRCRKKIKLEPPVPVAAATLDESTTGQAKLRKQKKRAAVASEEPTEDLVAEPSQPKQRRLAAKLKQKQKKKNSAASGNPGDRLKISEQRLLELGIDPKKFRRMRHQKRGVPVEEIDAE